MTRRYEETLWIDAPPERVFAVADDAEALAAHMAEPSWRMAGGHLRVTTDERRGREVGSHIRMEGRVLGIPLGLDEVVTEREAPERKSWATVGDPALLVVGPYRMRVDVRPENGGTRLIVAIDYDDPRRRPWLGRMFGRTYAKWCVRQMKGDVKKHVSGA